MCNNYDQVTYCPVVQFVARLNRIGVRKELKTVFGLLSTVELSVWSGVTVEAFIAHHPLVSTSIAPPTCTHNK